MSIQPSLPTQSSPSRRKVLIVGGGPAGLAVALMLAKRNWTEITVLEKRVAADYYEPDKSFNYLIDGRGQKFTDLLGLTEQLSAIGVANTEFYPTIIQPSGSRKTLKLPLIDPTRQSAFWVPRRAFVQLLYQEIQQNWSDQITVLFNTQCVEINKEIRDGFETLEVLVEGETPSRQQRFEPRFLIGCDGLHSIVRSTLNTWEHSGKFEMQQFPSPSSGLRYKVLSLPPNFPLTAEGKERALATMSYVIRGIYRERKRSLSLNLLPLTDPEAPRTVNLITYPDHQLWQLKTSEEVLDFFDHAFPQLPLRQIVLPEEIERFAKSNGGTFPSPQFCSGLYYRPHAIDTKASETTVAGVLLLGDAVHCFPPDIGQGVNSALEDVFVFYQILEENQDDLMRSLPQYEAVRSPDVRALIRLAQVAAPWQYNQDPLRGKLWTITFIFRLGLSKFLPFISSPAFALIRNHNLSYQEIWLREQRTTLILSVMSLLLTVFIGLLGMAVRSLIM